MMLQYNILIIGYQYILDVWESLFPFEMRIISAHYNQGLEH
jgi:hypothetical protein